MKTLLLTAFAAIGFTASGWACDDSTKTWKSNNGTHKYWTGLDVGVNGFMSSGYDISTPENYPFLELDYARSRSIAWNMGQYNVKLVKNYVQLVTGLGLEWNTYSLRNNVTLLTDAPTVSAVNENVNFSKNKFRTIWVNAPLLLEFNTSKDEDKSFHVAGGVTFGYNMFRNRLKQEFSANGDNVKRKLKDDFNVNPFRYSLTARVGYGDFTLFANYALTELFKSGRGPEVYPFSAGININF